MYGQVVTCPTFPSVPCHDSLHSFRGIFSFLLAIPISSNPWHFSLSHAEKVVRKWIAEGCVGQLASCPYTEVGGYGDPWHFLFSQASEVGGYEDSWHFLFSQVEKVVRKWIAEGCVGQLASCPYTEVGGYGDPWHFLFSQASEVGGYGDSWHFLFSQVEKVVWKWIAEGCVGQLASCPYTEVGGYGDLWYFTFSRRQRLGGYGDLGISLFPGIRGWGIRRPRISPLGYGKGTIPLWNGMYHFPIAQDW